jgi:uncharacterized MnhB-related membrane protein
MIILLLSSLIIILAVIIVNVKDLLYAVILLGGISVIISLIFLYLQAPDLAITKASVACISTLIFLIAIKKTERLEK